MEGHPEEDHDGEDGEECCDALTYLLGAHLDLLAAQLRPVSASHCLLPGIGEARLVYEEDDQGDEDHHDGCGEGVVEALREDAQVALGEVLGAGEGLTIQGHAGRELLEVLQRLGLHALPMLQVVVAEGRQVGVVG